MIEIGTIERAFELARSGQCQTISELIVKLRREGRNDVDRHLDGAGIRKQITAIIRENRSPIESEK